MTSSAAPTASPPLERDEANRIWQHGLHEDTLFQHRLASFTLIESVLLGFFGNLYGKTGTEPFVWYVAILALCFSVIWLFIQYRHWAYLNHVTKRIQQFAPEFKSTLSTFSSYWLWRFDTPRLLALAIPTLFVVIWTFLLGWMLLKPSDEVQSKFGISLDRFLISILIAVVIWLFLRLRKVEKVLLTPTGLPLNRSPGSNSFSSSTASSSPPAPNSSAVASASVSNFSRSSTAPVGSTPTAAPAEKVVRLSREPDSVTTTPNPPHVEVGDSRPTVSS